MPPLLPFALDSGVTAPFVVQRTFRSLLPLSTQLWLLSGLASAFHLCLIPIKSFQKGRQRWGRGRLRWAGDRAGGWVAGPARIKARRPDGRAGGGNGRASAWRGAAISRAVGRDPQWAVTPGGLQMPVR